jgi:hypothetical protein
MRFEDPHSTLSNVCSAGSGPQGHYVFYISGGEKDAVSEGTV